MIRILSEHDVFNRICKICRVGTSKVHEGFPSPPADGVAPGALVAGGGAGAVLGGSSGQAAGASVHEPLLKVTLKPLPAPCVRALMVHHACESNAVMCPKIIKSPVLG